MTETYFLSEYHNSYVTFKPVHPNNWSADRQFSMRDDVWIKLGRPTEIMVTVENLEPFKDKVFNGK